MSTILAIETSCDETAICLVETQGKLGEDLEVNLLGNALYSQVATHAQYGGVFPSLAKREHQRNLVPLLVKVLQELSTENQQPDSLDSGALLNAQHSTLNALLTREPELQKQLMASISLLEVRPLVIDAVAITYGPGLEPALWTGINFARALSELWQIPLIPINHMEGHIFSALLSRKENSKFKDLNSNQNSKSQIHNSATLYSKPYTLNPIKFPALALLISGGHTQLVLMEGWFKYKILGETRDDAVGEAFDKVARMLELPYPGGPHISKLAEKARSETQDTSDKIQNTEIKLPRPMINDNSYDFSFSGLKTAVLYLLRNQEFRKSDFLNVRKKEVAKEFEDAVTEVLVAKTMRAMEEYGTQTLIIGGGVSANAHVRQEFAKNIKKRAPDTTLLVPEPALTGDNAVMIATAASARVARDGLTNYSVNPDLIADGNLKL